MPTGQKLETAFRFPWFVSPPAIPTRSHHAGLVWLLPMLWTFALGLWGLSRQDSVWRDEAATWQVAQRSTVQIWHMLANVDVVHGFYYLLMHLLFECFGPSTTTLRLPSVLATAVAAACVAVIGRRVAGGPSRRNGFAAAADRAVLSPGRSVIRAGGGRSRGFDAVPHNSPPTAGQDAPLGRLRRGRASREPAELALPHDPRGTPGYLALDPCRAWSPRPLGGGSRVRQRRCVAVDRVQPEPVRAAVLDPTAVVAHADRPGGTAGDRRCRRTAGSLSGGSLVVGGRGVAAAGGAATGPHRAVPDSTDLPGPLHPLQHAGVGTADRYGRRLRGTGGRTPPPGSSEMGASRSARAGNAGPAAAVTGQAVPG